MSYNSLYDMFKLGISSVISWMESLEYEGINLLHIAFVAFFFSLIWQFVLAPVLGNRPGGISIGASDLVSRYADSKEDSPVPQHTIEQQKQKSDLLAKWAGQQSLRKK